MIDYPKGEPIALTAGVLVTGKTGSGKTSTSKRLIEDLCIVDRQPRVCILDPIKSDWWGITLDADGKTPGLPFVILGGPHGHVPLSDTAGTAIGELVASGQLPMSIIDMAHFKMGGLQRFYCDFAEVLFKRNKHPLHLVLEEAHEFAPKERAGIGAESMALYWSKKLATAGRSKGLRMIACTQRTQSLHNAVMGSLETLLAHRMSYPADVEPVVDWIRKAIGKAEALAIEAAMQKLANGEAFVCNEGKARRHQFMKMRTFDNTKTPDGTEIDAAPPPVDRSKLLEIVGQAVKEAEENDVATLKARIKALESGATAVPPEIMQKALDAAHHAGRKEAFNEAYGRWVAALDKISELMNGVLNPGNQALFGPGVETPHAVENVAPPPVRQPPAPARVVSRTVPPVETGKGTTNTGAGNISWKEKLLAALYPYRELTIVELGVVSGSYHTSGPFRAALRQLLDQGLFEQAGDIIGISKAGSRAANQLSEVSANKLELATIAEKWRGKTNRFADDVLEYLAMNAGKQRYSASPITFAELQAKLGHVHTSGPFRKGIKQLKNAGLLEGDSSGVRLTKFVLEASL